MDDIELEVESEKIAIYGNKSSKTYEEEQKLLYFLL